MNFCKCGKEAKYHKWIWNEEKEISELHCPDSSDSQMRSNASLGRESERASAPTDPEGEQSKSESSISALGRAPKDSDPYYPLDEYDPNDTYFDDGDEDRCEGCGRGHYDGGACPLCCGHMYAPGTEDCEFCDYEGECAEYASKL